ncbi:hypothetical protein AJ88_25110 [Mesorhizobium amorphae CCBAU 01583]|nr:hypothetical protein AJ88_25110 [Mesorhizobium amorphae CCBAU 01583]
MFLEDRRVLYNPFNIEVEADVERSIHQIREECTKTIKCSRQAPKLRYQSARSERLDGRSMTSVTTIFHTSICAGIIGTVDQVSSWR